MVSFVNFCCNSESFAGHNFKVEVRWLYDGSDPARSCWWHITEITLNHLRPSQEWKKQVDELQLVKECEAQIRKQQKKLNSHFSDADER